MLRSLLFKFLCLKYATLALLLLAIPAYSQTARDQGTMETLTQYLNTASPADLDNLPGIGPKLVTAIIDNRPYKTLGDVRTTKGIGDRRLEKLYRWATEHAQ